MQCFVRVTFAYKTNSETSLFGCKVRAQDLAGQEFEAEYDGFLSRVVQHEYDHLEGVLLVDRMSPADKHRHRHALEALKERYQREKAKLEAAAGRARR